MNSDLLRKGCEMVGLVISVDAARPLQWTAITPKSKPGLVYAYRDDNPALPAYVASLLEARNLTAFWR